MSNGAATPTNTNLLEDTMITNNVQMNDTVIVRGAAYTVTDEPIFVRVDGRQMIEWNLAPVAAGLRTGLLRGAFRVFPGEGVQIL